MTQGLREVCGFGLILLLIPGRRLLDLLVLDILCEDMDRLVEFSCFRLGLGAEPRAGGLHVFQG